MNIKNIIGIILMFVALASCSEETFIEQSYQTEMCTLNFTMEGVKTKVETGTASSSYATEQELTVNNCFIAIYTNKPGETNTWDVKVLSDNYKVAKTTKGFTISGIALPFKTNLKLVAIANLPEDNLNEYKLKTTYQELVEHASVITAFSDKDGLITFDPESLIKFGSKDLYFDVINQNIEIALTQLAAKISLNLAVGGEEKDSPTFTLNQIDIKNVECHSKVLAPAGNSNSTHLADKSLPFNEEVTKIDNISFYTYEKPYYNGNQDAEVLTIFVKGVWSKQENNYPNSFTLKINPASSTQSTKGGLLHGNYYYVTGTLKQQISDITVSVKKWTNKDLDVEFK